jgi:hypothetical protein
MNDTELTKLLRGLPRTSASPRFNSDVMRAIRTPEEQPRSAFTWRVATAFAMAFCLVLVVQIGLLRQREAARMDALRAEQHRIQAELAAVKEQASTYEPVVIMEHTDGTRVVVDQTPKDPAIVPASYTFN